jgi:glutathione S-transferase
MTDKLVFYTNPMSRGRIARWMLEEVGAPYETVLLDYGSTMKQEPFLSINPMGKVPALTHGGQVITECAAIIAYLADAFPEAGLAPAPTSPERATYLRWMFFAAGPVEAASAVAGLGVSIPPEKQGMVGWGSHEQVMARLEEVVSHAKPYILGETFSAVDVYLGMQIAFGLQFGSMPKKPSFEAYVGNLMARPAAIRAREIDDALMAG